MSVTDNIVVDKELTPELIKRKEELDLGLWLELDRINYQNNSSWAYRYKPSADIQQKYEDMWEQELTDAGYVVRHIFEGLERPQAEEHTEDWYEELNKINN